MSFYVDGAEWCVLINRNISESIIKDLRKDIYEYIWMFQPLHVEPIERYRYQPPENRNWKLHKRGLTESEALNFYKTDEYKSLVVEILSENGIYLRQSQQPKNGSERQHGKGWKSIRFDIMKRDGYKCQLCGKTASDGAKLEVDHKLALANGGKNTPDNLWVLCFDCNRGKKTKDL